MEETLTPGGRPPKHHVEKLDFVLPSQWWLIPLADKTVRRHAIKALCERQVGRADNRAQLRHELSAELTQQAGNAETVGALFMAFYLAELEGAPLAAAMTCYDLTALMDPFKHLPNPLDQYLQSNPDVEYCELSDQPFPSYRHDALLSSSLPDYPDAPTIPQLHVTYLQLLPGNMTVQTVFTTPISSARAAWLDLFDTIVSSYQFQSAKRAGITEAGSL